MMRRFISCMFLQPLKNMIKKIRNRNNSDDDSFNHPFVILQRSKNSTLQIPSCPEGFLF